MTDLWTVFLKELKEMFMMREGLRRGAFSALIFLGVFGIFLPLQMGRDWVQQPSVLVLWGWVPLFLVISMVADSFAGERERHTLETLLSTRLSDGAILGGKILAAVAYGWGQTMASLLLGLVVVNIAFGKGELLIYSGTLLVAIVCISLLVSFLAAGIGVLTSLRATSVRQAQQSMNLVVLVLFFGIVYGSRALPAAWQASMMSLLSYARFGSILWIVAASLLALNAIFLSAAAARFRRTRLILD